MGRMIEQLQDALNNDPELFNAYKDNIAMAIKDEYARYVRDHNYKRINRNDMHIIANNGAEHFLNLLKAR